MFLLDTRERELIPRLPAWTVKTLPIADVWIGCSGEQILPGGIFIERKEIHDLEASMKDGRYREQRTRMQAAATASGAHILYVLEGDINTVRSFSKETVWKWLDRLMFVHKISVYQTRTVDETALFLKTLAEKWQEDQTEFRDGKVTAYTTTIKNHTKGEQRDDPHNFAVSVLTCCKGISSTTAEAILKGCGGHLEGVWAATEQQLADLKLSEKQRVGPAKAKKLVSLLHSRGAVSLNTEHSVQ
jgi:ERCC4-type nuclease